LQMRMNRLPTRAAALSTMVRISSKREHAK
jgi:hypothetical protein